MEHLPFPDHSALRDRSFLAVSQFLRDCLFIGIDAADDALALANAIGQLTVAVRISCPAQIFPAWWARAGASRSFGELSGIQAFRL